MPFRLQQKPTSLTTIQREAALRLPELSFSHLRPALALSARAVARAFGASMPGDGGETIGADPSEADGFGVSGATEERDTPYGLVAAAAAGESTALSRFADLLNVEDHRFLCSSISDPGLLRKVTDEDPIGDIAVLIRSNDARRLILIACIASLTAASAAARFIAGVNDQADDPKKPEWLWTALALIKLSIASAMEICGLRTFVWSGLSPVTRDRETTQIALRSFKADFAVYERLVDGEIRSNWGIDLLGGGVNTGSEGPFGPLWAGGEVPGWARPPSSSYAASRVLGPLREFAEAEDVSSIFAKVDGTDAYCVTLTGDDNTDERVATVVAGIDAMRAKILASNDQMPLLVVHGPELRPELAGKVVAAGAYYLPGLAVGGVEPKDTAELRQAVATLLGADGSGSEAARSGPNGWPRRQPPVAWISPDPSVSSEEALRNAQARYSKQASEDLGWPVGP